MYGDYNFGLGIQIYLTNKLSIRLSYGLDNNDQYSLLTDRTNLAGNNNCFSGSIRYNILEKKYLLGYLNPYYKYSFGSNSKGYNDDFTDVYKYSSRNFSVGIGSEIFAISCKQLM